MARVKHTIEDKQLMRIIGDNIKYYRINNNCSDDITDKYGRISQEKLAELTGTSASMIANIEAPNVLQGMSITYLNKIAETLSIPLYAFFLKRPIKNPPEDPFSGPNHKELLTVTNVVKIDNSLTRNRRYR